jgi:hypothetical protein
MGRFSQINSLVQNATGWAGFIGLLFAGYTYLASRLTLMKGFGLADFVAVGIAAALLTALVIAAILAAWRYFRPLPLIDTMSGTGQAIESGLFRSEERGGEFDRRLQSFRSEMLTGIDGANKSIAEVREKLTVLSHATTNSLGAHDSRLDEVGRQLNAIHSDLQDRILSVGNQIFGASDAAGKAAMFAGALTDERYLVQQREKFREAFKALRDEMDTLLRNHDTHGRGLPTGKWAPSQPSAESLEEPAGIALVS